MLKKVFSNSSAMGIVLVMTSSWVGQAQAFVFTYGAGTQQTHGVNCSNATYGSGTVYDGWSGCNTADTRFKASTSVTSQATLRTAAANVSNLISGRMSAVQGPLAHKTASTNLLGNGISAGGYEHGADVWFNASMSHLDNHKSSTKYKGDIVDALIGLDYDASDDLRTGVGFGYESSGFSTAVNNGGVRGTGGMIVPYMAFDLDDMWKLDLHLGYARLKYDLRRMDPASTDAPLQITGESHANRYFGAVNMTAMHQCHQWNFNGRTGLMYAVENLDAFTDTSAHLVSARKTKLGRFDAVLNAAYDLGKDFEPYVGVNPLWDFEQSDVKVYQGALYDISSVNGVYNSLGAAQKDAPNGRFAVVYSAGLRMDVMKRFDAVLTASTEQHRKHQKRNAVSLSANAEF